MRMMHIAYKGQIMINSTLGNETDNSLVSNAFGFLRLPLNFQPYDSDADWVITGFRLIWRHLAARGAVMDLLLSAKFQLILRGKVIAGRGISSLPRN